MDKSAGIEKMNVMQIAVKANPELYELISLEADRRGVAMGRILVELAAKYFKRPDLDYVPRKKMGRPRKEKTTANAN